MHGHKLPAASEGLSTPYPTSSGHSSLAHHVQLVGSYKRSVVAMHGASDPVRLTGLDAPDEPDVERARFHPHSLHSTQLIGLSCKGDARLLSVATPHTAAVYNVQADPTLNIIRKAVAHSICPPAWHKTFHYRPSRGMGDCSRGNIFGGEIQAEPEQANLNEGDRDVSEAWRKSNLLVLGNSFAILKSS